MAEAGGFFRPSAPPALPLSTATVEALRGLPGGVDVPRHRDQVLAQVGPLATVMRRAEVEHRSGRLPAHWLAQLWSWVGYLATVRGFRAATTVAQYARSVSRLLEWAAAEDVDPDCPAPAEFDRWQQWLALELKHSARWRMRQVCAAKSFYAWRHTRGLGADSAADLVGPKTPQGMARKYTLTQLQGMLRATQSRRDEAMRLRDGALLMLLLATGLRREEMSRLDLSALHLGQRSGLVRVVGKGAKEREVPFEGPVVALLREWLLARDALPFPFEPDAVFVGLVGIGRGCRLRPRAIERCVAAHAKAAGLRDWGVHRFRVTFATTLYDDGEGIEEIRILMGHESIETTRRYIAVSERARRTRMKADRQHEVLGTRNADGPRWMRAALGGCR